MDRLTLERELTELGVREFEGPTRPLPGAGADVVEPFPRHRYILSLQMNNQGLIDCGEVVARDADVGAMAGAMVDLAGKPALPPYFGFNDIEMLYVASLAKIYPMYAAFDLRRRVAAHVKDSGGGTPAKIFADLTRAWQPKLNAAFPNLPRGFPRLADIFTLSSSGEVKFAQRDPPVTDAELDAVGEHGAPIGKYHDWMRLMLRWSNNAAAGRCIRALSYPYINGVLAAAGFFDRAGKTGLWISGDYMGNDWLPGDRAGQRLSPRWARLQKRAVSNFTGTAMQVARFMTLLAQGRLVDPAASREMVRIMTGAYGIGSYIAGGLRRAAPPRAFGSIRSKIGYGNDRFSHDCAIVGVARGADPAKALRYVSVALGSPPTKARADLNKLAVGFHDCIVAQHP